MDLVAIGLRSSSSAGILSVSPEEEALARGKVDDLKPIADLVMTVLQPVVMCTKIVEGYISKTYGVLN